MDNILQTKVPHGDAMIAALQLRNQSDLGMLQQELTPERRVDALIELAEQIERDEGDSRLSYDSLSEAEKTAENADYKRGLLDARTALAAWHFKRAEFAPAITFAKSAHMLALEYGDPLQQYQALNTLAKIYGMIGDYAEALELLTQFFRLGGDGMRAYAPIVRANIGAIYIRMEQWDRALDESVAALETTNVMPEAERQRHTLNVYDNITYIHLKRGDPQAAKRSAEAGIAYCKSVGVPVQNALLLMLGKAYQQLGDYAIEHMN